MEHARSVPKHIYKGFREIQIIAWLTNAGDQSAVPGEEGRIATNSIVVLGRRAQDVYFDSISFPSRIDCKRIAIKRVRMFIGAFNDAIEVPLLVALAPF